MGSRPRLARDVNGAIVAAWRCPSLGLLPIPQPGLAKLADEVARWEQVRHDVDLVEVVDGNESVIVAETWVVSRCGRRDWANIHYIDIPTTIS